MNGGYDTYRHTEVYRGEKTSCNIVKNLGPLCAARSRKLYRTRMTPMQATRITTNLISENQRYEVSASSAFH
jgi:(2Fe-2S) ferredoxin